MLVLKEMPADMAIQARHYWQEWQGTKDALEMSRSMYDQMTKLMGSDMGFQEQGRVIVRDGPA